jgi:hypothetical protein
VILEEELEEFLLMAPLAFVVVLDGVGLVGAGLRRRTLRRQGSCKGSSKDDGENDKNDPAHKASMDTMEAIVA